MDEYILHARQKRLLYILNGMHGIATGKELALKLGVSKRTIRNDITEINEALHGYKIQIKSIRGKGYSLYIEDRKLFHKLFSEYDNIQTKEDRIKYLLMLLIRNESWSDLRNLEDSMFISRTTLENDIREIKNRIVDRQPYIQLVRMGNLIKLENNEGKKRKILVHLYYENWDYHSRDGIMLKEDLISQDLLNQSRILLKKILKEYNIELDDFGMIYMVLSISVAYARTLEEQKLKVMNYRCSDPHINEAAKALLEQMKSLWEVEFEEEEWHWMADVLDQLTLLNLQNITKEQVLKRVSKESIELLEKLLEEVKNNYFVDFASNSKFYINMLTHIQALLNGMISVHIQNEYLVEELRMKYPLLGDICCYLCRRIENITGLRMRRSEENYLFPLLLIAQENTLRHYFAEGIKVVLVSHLNIGMSEYLLQKLEEIYGIRLDIRGPIPIYDRDKIDQIQPEFIISTVQMNDFREFDIPIIIVSPLISHAEKSRIEKCINNIEKEYLHPSLPQNHNVYFCKELTIDIERKVGVSEIVNIVEENLRINLYINDEEDIDWENGYCSLLREGYAFLYAWSDLEQPVLASIVNLKYAVSYKEMRNIKTFFVFVINKKDNRYLGHIYDSVIEMIDKLEMK